jgi:hypothetical protein
MKSEVEALRKGRGRSYVPNAQVRQVICKRGNCLCPGLNDTVRNARPRRPSKIAVKISFTSFDT